MFLSRRSSSWSTSPFVFRAWTKAGLVGTEANLRNFEEPRNLQHWLVVTRCKHSWRASWYARLHPGTTSRLPSREIGGGEEGEFGAGDGRKTKPTCLQEKPDSHAPILCLTAYHSSISWFGIRYLWICDTLISSEAPKLLFYTFHQTTYLSS